MNEINELVEKIGKGITKVISNLTDAELAELGIAVIVMGGGIGIDWSGVVADEMKKRMIKQGIDVDEIEKEALSANNNKTIDEMLDDLLGSIGLN